MNWAIVRHHQQGGSKPGRPPDRFVQPNPLRRGDRHRCNDQTGVYHQVDQDPRQSTGVFMSNVFHALPVVDRGTLVGIITTTTSCASVSKTNCCWKNNAPMATRRTSSSSIVRSFTGRAPYFEEVGAKMSKVQRGFETPLLPTPSGILTGSPHCLTNKNFNAHGFTRRYPAG